MNFGVVNSTDQDSGSCSVATYSPSKEGVKQQGRGVCSLVRSDKASRSFFELDHSSNNEGSNVSPSLSRRVRDSSKLPHPSNASPLYVCLRYTGLSTLAVMLTVACPGGSSLWRNSNDEGIRVHVGSDKDEFQWIVCVPILLSYLATLGLFFFVVSSDPGYLTRELVDQLDGAEEPVRQRNHVESLPLLPTRDDDTASNLPTARRRPYCQVCNLAPPLRAHHCKACQRCVASFDHHCPLIGNCVGERNHAIFVLFLISQLLGLFLCLQSVGSSSLGVSNLVFGSSNAYSNSISPPAMRQTLQAVATKLYLLPLTATAFAMVLVHTGMVAANATTFECARHHRLEYLRGTELTDLPFSQGVARNVAFAFRKGTDQPWTPMDWSLPECSNDAHDSPDWWNHLARNKYWSCC